MYGSKVRFWLIAAIVAIFIVIFGAIIFNSATDNQGANTPARQTKVDKKIQEYNNGDSFVRMTIDGEVTAKEKHRQIRVTVSQNGRTLDIFGGYNYQVLNSKQYDNTPEAYNVFLHALATAGFLKKRNNVTSDYTGACPLGTRTIFELYNKNEKVEELWTSSCGGKVGNFGGNTSMTTTLFKNQIPDYSTLTSGVTL